jgi:hypothetical protein
LQTGEFTKVPERLLVRCREFRAQHPTFEDVEVGGVVTEGFASRLKRGMDASGRGASQKTLERYASMSKDFARFCGRRGISPFPVHPEAVEAYFDWLAADPKSNTKGTFEGRRRALAAMQTVRVRPTRSARPSQLLLTAPRGRGTHAGAFWGVHAAAA